MARAGRLLAVRPRSRAELEQRLLEDADAHVVGRALERLEELELVNDHEFARLWVEQRAGTRGRTVLTQELRRKGIDPEIAEAAVGVAAASEEARARALAAGRVARIAHLPLPTQARRLEQMLLRRGFDAETVMDAVRRVLPPEGWD
jgi:regulatory protein